MSRVNAMAYVKLREGVLAGTEAFSGIAVLSQAFNAAHCFGDSGYDEGDLDGYRMAAATASPSRPATQEDVFDAARALGRTVTDEDTPNGMLADPEVRAEVARRGFDGFSGYEVIGNMQPEVTIVWDAALLRVLPDPHASVGLEADGDGLRLRLRSVASREALYRALRSHEGRLEEAGPYAVASLPALAGWRAEGQALVATDGRTYDASGLDVHRLVDEGEAFIPEAAPGFRP